MSVTVPPTEENIGLSNPPVEIVDRYPIEDRKKHRFPENSQYCCIPGNAKIKYIKSEKRRPYFFTFCFTLDDHSRSYGTSLFYYEKLKINGEYRYDKKGRHLYVPRSLCILSHQPIFSVFSVFLRELYRNSIMNMEDTFADEQSMLPRVESFEALLRKGSSIDLFSDDSISELPLEKHITHFVDYCPSLEPGTLFHIPVFQKVATLRMPPVTCLPYTDRLCFDCLYTSLSPKNILKCIAAILQEQRILLVSEQTDSLTLCAQALVSLIYPFRWYHPFIPIIPLSITESVSATFPYIFGVTTEQYESPDCQHNLDGVIVVYLDYDQVILPKNQILTGFNNGFTKRFVRYAEKHIPPPSTRVLYCNDKNINEASFVVFEVLFGPGKLGVRLRSKEKRLRKGEEKQEMTYLARIDDDDMTITGPGKRVALINREPVVLCINSQSVVGMSHSEVRSIIEKSKRPLLMRCQIGVLSAEMETLAIHSETPMGDSPQENTPKEEEKEMETTTPTVEATTPTTSWSPVLRTPCDEDCQKVHRHYNFITEKEKTLTYENEKIDYYEKMRVLLMLELVRVMGHYKKHFYKDAEEGATMNDIINLKSFLKAVDEDDTKFVKKISKTQLFQHFIEDAFEYEDNYEINLFNDCVAIVKGMGDYAHDFIMSKLTPSNWDMEVVDVPAAKMEEEIAWDGMDLLGLEQFPRMKPELYGKKSSRMKLEQKEHVKTIVPEDMKALVKSMKKS